MDPISMALAAAGLISNFVGKKSATDTAQNALNAQYANTQYQQGNQAASLAAIRKALSDRLTALGPGLAQRQEATQGNINARLAALTGNQAGRLGAIGATSGERLANLGRTASDRLAALNAVSSARLGETTSNAADRLNAIKELLASRFAAIAPNALSRLQTAQQGVRQAGATRVDQFGNKLTYDPTTNTYTPEFTPEQQALIEAGQTRQGAAAARGTQASEDFQRARAGYLYDQPISEAQGRDEILKLITAARGEGDRALQTLVNRQELRQTGNMPVINTGTILNPGPGQRLAQDLLNARTQALQEYGTRLQQHEAKYAPALARSETTANYVAPIDPTGSAVTGQQSDMARAIQAALGNVAGAYGEYNKELGGAYDTGGQELTSAYNTTGQEIGNTYGDIMKGLLGAYSGTEQAQTASYDDIIKALTGAYTSTGSELQGAYGATGKEQADMFGDLANTLSSAYGDTGKETAGAYTAGGANVNAASGLVNPATATTTKIEQGPDLAQYGYLINAMKGKATTGGTTRAGGTQPSVPGQTPTPWLQSSQSNPGDNWYM
jgi:hypothetical protein